jgi:transcriptional regulator with XRE-family HTH domain
MVRESDRGRPAGTVTIVLGVKIDGGRLRDLLLSRATSIRAVGALLGIPESRLHDWISERYAPQPETLSRILRTLRADLLDVLPAGTEVTLEVLRWRAGKTIAQVVAATDMSRRRYGDLEDGHHRPTDDEITQLAVLYGTDADEIRAASRRHAEITYVIHVPATLARRVQQLAERRGKPFADTFVDLAEAGLNLESPPAE